jgi:hypothetical protein
MPKYSTTATKILKLHPYKFRAVQLLFILDFKQKICIAEIGKQEVGIVCGFKN